jgi:hypothetical protein
MNREKRAELDIASSLLGLSVTVFKDLIKTFLLHVVVPVLTEWGKNHAGTAEELFKYGACKMVGPSDNPDLVPDDDLLDDLYSNTTNLPTVEILGKKLRPFHIHCLLSAFWAAHKMDIPTLGILMKTWLNTRELLWGFWRHHCQWGSRFIAEKATLDEWTNVPEKQAK